MPDHPMTFRGRLKIESRNPKGFIHLFLIITISMFQNKSPKNNAADSDHPPVLQSWSRIYIAVIAFLLLQIIIYSIITELLK